MNADGWSLFEYMLTLSILINTIQMIIFTVYYCDMSYTTKWSLYTEDNLCWAATPFDISYVPSMSPLQAIFFLLHTLKNLG